MHRNDPTPLYPDDQILRLALEAFERETGLRSAPFARAKPGHPKRVGADAVISLAGVEYPVEIKRWAQHAPLGVIIERMQRHRSGLLVADYVNAQMAERLHEAGIQFIDTAGNAYIRTPHHHVWIKGNRTTDAYVAFSKPRKHRAFTTTGLKVTYALLCQPSLAAAPYRQIATAAGVALGTVSKVIDDLIETGYLVDRDGTRQLIRRDQILDAWLDRYPAVLRPKLVTGVFQAPAADWWKNFDITAFEGVWTGEVAGAHFTSYLRPAQAAAYVPEHAQVKLIAAARLRKLTKPTDTTGTVELLTPFWPMNKLREISEQVKENAAAGFVHPILAYADLIVTGDARNLEVARKLYDERIVKSLR